MFNKVVQSLILNCHSLVENFIGHERIKPSADSEIFWACEEEGVENNPCPTAFPLHFHSQVWYPLMWSSYLIAYIAGGFTLFPALALVFILLAHLNTLLCDSTVWKLGLSAFRTSKIHIHRVP